MDELRLLENSGVCRILEYMLISKEGVKKIEFRNQIGLSPPTAERAFNLLFDNGLIHNKHAKELLFELTDKGKEVADHLYKIKMILTSENINN